MTVLPADGVRHVSTAQSRSQLRSSDVDILVAGVNCIVLHGNTLLRRPATEVMTLTLQLQTLPDR